MQGLPRGSGLVHIRHRMSLISCAKFLKSNDDGSVASPGCRFPLQTKPGPKRIPHFQAMMSVPTSPIVSSSPAHIFRKIVNENERFRSQLGKLMKIRGERMSTITDLQDEVKRHKLFVNWIEIMVGFFKKESSPRPLFDYRRGQVIWVDFGFNVGYEFGGDHPAIVLIDTPPNNQKVLVLPLTSKPPKKPFAHHVHVGKLHGLKPDHWATVYEIRSVDKLRTRMDAHASPVSGAMLDRISNTIVQTVALRTTP